MLIDIADNIAPPVAACLGDLVTLSLLGVIAELHLYILHTPIPLIIVLTLVAAAVGWTFVTNRNENVKHLLREGWSPLFIAMAISSGTGIVLDTFVERYSGFALLAVVITGMSTFPSDTSICSLTRPLHRSPWWCKLNLCISPIDSPPRRYGQSVVPGIICPGPRQG